MSFFRLDGPVFQFLERVANLIILNLLFLLCCIPVVTIGPALTALHYVSMKLMLKEESGIIRDFFHAFRLNFRQSFLLSLIFAGIIAILGVDIYLLLFSAAIPEGTVSIFFVATGVLAGLFFLVYSYVFPILARFHVTVPGCLKAATVMAFSHFFTTICILGVSLVPLFILYLPVIQILYFVVPFFTIIGFALMSFAQSWFLLKVFRRYAPDES